MKKLFFILICSLVVSGVKAQTSVRLTSETVGYWTIEGDTMNIVKADNVVGGSVYCPSYSTDSVTISGCTFEIDGITSSDIKIPPGEAALNFGFRYALSDSLNIAVPDKAFVVLLIKR